MLSLVKRNCFLDKITKQVPAFDESFKWKRLK